MPECPIRAPFSALPRFMPQNISSKTFFFQQAKVFCQTKSNKKRKKREENRTRRASPNAANEQKMLQISQWEGGRAKLRKLKWKLPIVAVAAAFQFELPFCTCLMLHSPFSILHLPLSILDNLKKPPPLHFIHVAPFDFISYFLLNLCCRSAVEEEAG